MKYRLKQWHVAVILSVLLCAVMAAGQRKNAPSLEEQMKAASQIEIRDSDFRGAIDAYQKVVDNAGGNKAIAARALVEIGRLEELLHKPEARGTYEKIITKYPDQNKAVVTAQMRLKALGEAEPTGSVSLTTKRVCSNGCTGGTSEASITSDEKFLTYTEGTAGDLAIRELSSGQIVRPMGTRGNGKSYARDPLLSPDLKQLVFAWTDDEGKNFQLKVMSNDLNAQPRSLVNNPEYHVLLPAAWSLDGKSVLVAASKPDKTWQFAWVSIADGKVKTLKSLGWRYQYRMGRPSLSRDGNIAYSALDSDRGPLNGRNESYNQHIYVLKADGSAPEIEVIKGANINEAPVWTPDGKNLLFVSNREASFSVWSVALQDGKPDMPLPLMPNTGRISVVGMTGSGSFYYEDAQEKTTERISIASLKAKVPGSPDSVESFSGSQPSWSPDGKSIAFLRPIAVSNPAQNPVANNESLALIVYSVGSGDERRYVPNPSLGLTPVDEKPIWFHNGKALLQVMQNSRKERSFYRVDLKTEEFRQIPVSRGSLSPDDSTLYLAEFPKPSANQDPSVGKAQMLSTVVQMLPIVAIDISSGSRKHVTDIPNPYERVLISPDGKTLYAKGCKLKQGGRWSTPDLPMPPLPWCDSIVAIDIVTGKQRSVLTLEDEKDSPLTAIALSPDGSTILFGTVSSSEDSGVLVDRQYLNRIGVDGNGRSRLFGPQIMQILSWTPDGTAVLVSTFDSTSRAFQVLKVPMDGADPIELPVEQPPTLTPYGITLPPNAPKNMLDAANSITLSSFKFDPSPDGLQYTFSSPGSSSPVLRAIVNVPARLRAAR